MPTIADTEAQIRADDRPILFLDTCIYLDIIRATDRCLKGFVQSGSELLGLLTAVAPGCTLVAASMVPIEWTDNAQKVRDEVNGNLAKIQERASMFHEACGILGIGLTFGRPMYPSVGLVERLYALSKELLDRSMLLNVDSECTSRGVNRLVGKIPPSKHGREVKDCVILEECLELVRQLRANGFGCKCVFCTSNMKDYGDPNGKLHPILVAEFATIDLRFTSDLTWAVHEVML